MRNYEVLRHNRYFRIFDLLNRKNMSDLKVAMLSEIDMSSAVRLRHETEQTTGVRPSYTALVAKAVSLAIRRHPHANRLALGFLAWHRVVQLHEVDVGVAVERDRPGHEQDVFVGTIRRTEHKDLAAITRELRQLAEATPESCPQLRAFTWIAEKFPVWLARWVFWMPRLSARLWIEHRGGAILISSPAKYGTDVMVAAWPWPLGFSFGLVKQRPIVKGGAVVARPTMTLTMSFDRRLMGGAPAARFFRTICEFLEQAETRLNLTGERITVSDEYDGDMRAKRRQPLDANDPSVASTRKEASSWNGPVERHLPGR